MVRDVILNLYKSTADAIKQHRKKPVTFKVGKEKTQYGIYTRTSAIKNRILAKSKRKPPAEQVELFSEAAKWLLNQFTVFGFKTEFVKMDKPLKCYFWVTDVLVCMSALSPALFMLARHYGYIKCISNDCSTRSIVINACLLLSPVVFYFTFRNKWNTICKIVQIMNCLSLGLKIRDATHPAVVVRRWARNFTIYGIVAIFCMEFKVIIGLVLKLGVNPLTFVALFIYSTQLIVFHYLKILVQGVIITICVFLTSKMRSYSRMNFKVVKELQAWQEFHLICSATRKLNNLINFTMFTTMMTSILRVPPLIKSFIEPSTFFELDFKESIPCIIAFFVNIACITIVNSELYKFARTMWFKPTAERFPKNLPYPSFKWKMAALQVKLNRLICIISFKLDPALITVYGTPMNLFDVFKMIMVATFIYLIKAPHGHVSLDVNTYTPAQILNKTIFAIHPFNNTNIFDFFDKF